MTRRNDFLIAQKNRHYIEMLLRGDKSYEFKPEIENITELQEFIKGLFEITDEFNIKEKQPSKDKLKEHLTEVKDYVVDNVGQNSKLVEDIDIEIRNQSADIATHTSFYDDLLKLRAAITQVE